MHSLSAAKERYARRNACAVGITLALRWDYADGDRLAVQHYAMVLGGVIGITLRHYALIGTHSVVNKNYFGNKKHPHNANPLSSMVSCYAAASK